MGGAGLRGPRTERRCAGVVDAAALASGEMMNELTPNNRAMCRFEHSLPIKLLIVIRSSHVSLAMLRPRPREKKRYRAKGPHAPGGA